VANEPFGSNSIKMSLMFSSIRYLHNRAIRKDAAQCELDGPRMTGPITSLNMLG
jgi:hypothetical protein